MADPEYRPDEFTCSFPLWFCRHKANPDIIVGGTMDGGRSKFVAAFSDRDLAERFLAARGLLAEAEIVDVPTPADLAGILKLLASAGCSHAVFDDDGKTTDARLVIEIGALIQATAGALE